MPDAILPMAAVAERLNHIEWSLRALAELAGAAARDPLPQGLDCLLTVLADQLSRLQQQLQP